MQIYENEIINLSKNEITLGFNLSYRLVGLILCPFNGHYICIIIKPSGKFLKCEFKNFKHYMHDDMKNCGLLIELDDSDNLFNHGIPYILIYKKNYHISQGYHQPNILIIQ